jgi:hypothetical protein
MSIIGTPTSSEIPFYSGNSMKSFKLVRINSYSSFNDFKEFYKSISEIFNMAKRNDCSRIASKLKILK